MKNYTRNYQIETPFREIECKVTLRHDIISDMPEIIDIQPIFTDHEPETKSDISEFIMQNFDICDEQIMDTICNEEPEVNEFDPNQIFDL